MALHPGWTAAHSACGLGTELGLTGGCMTGAIWSTSASVICRAKPPQGRWGTQKTGGGKPVPNSWQEGGLSKGESGGRSVNPPVEITELLCAEHEGSRDNVWTAAWGSQSPRTFASSQSLCPLTAGCAPRCRLFWITGCASPSGPGSSQAGPYYLPQDQDVGRQLAQTPQPLPEEGSLQPKPGWRRQGAKTPPGSRARRQGCPGSRNGKGLPLLRGAAERRERGLTAWFLGRASHAVDDAQQRRKERSSSG